MNMMSKDATKAYDKNSAPINTLLILSKLVIEDKFPHQIKDTDENTYN